MRINNNHIIKSKDEKIFSVMSYAFLTFVIIVCAYPFLNIIAKSFSSEGYILAGRIYLIPKGFNTLAYEIVLSAQRFWSSFFNSVFITVIGTVLNVSLTAFVAYGISKKELPGSNIISFLYIFTMLFGGGVIPTFIVVSNAGLYNSLWSLILPTLVSPFNLILMRNYFLTIPSELEDSGKIDGASQIIVLFRIVLPLALPSIVTIALFYAVGYWNEYFNALLYISDTSKTPVQLYLREMILNASDTNLNNMDLINLVAQEAIRGATVFCATLPILLVYPFLQKYYVQGMTVGAVKE